MRNVYKGLLLTIGVGMALGICACGRSEEGKSVKGESKPPKQEVLLDGDARSISREFGANSLTEIKKREVLLDGNATSISREFDTDSLTGIKVKADGETYRLEQDAVVKVVAAIRKAEAEGLQPKGRFPVKEGFFLELAPDAIVTLEFKSGKVRILEAVASIPPFLMYDRIAGRTLSVTLEKKVILRD